MNYKELLTSAKTDKECIPTHRYGMLYDILIHSLLKGDEKLSILEIGVGRGGSILTYCQSGDFEEVVGVDIKLNVNDEIDYKINEYDFANLHQMDAYTEGSLKYLSKNYGKFDLIIDDGPHTFASQKYFLERYHSLLKDGGLLLCEDVKRHFLFRFRKMKDDMGLYIIDLKQNCRNLESEHDDDIVILRRA